MTSLHDSLLIGLFGLSSLLTLNAPLTKQVQAGALRSVVLVEGNDLAQEPRAITAANWQQQPQIKAVRRAVAAVDAGLKNGTLKISRREFEYCEPYVDTLRRMAVDSQGVVRLYENEAG